MCSCALHVRLCGDHMPETGYCVCRNALDLQYDVGFYQVCDGACDAGSREESAGAAAAARVLCCALRLLCKCVRALCV